MICAVARKLTMNFKSALKIQWVQLSVTVRMDRGSTSASDFQIASNKLVFSHPDPQPLNNLVNGETSA